MLAGQERAATALIAGLGTADVRVPGLVERASVHSELLLLMSVT